MTLFDRLHGTLRRKNRQYSESTFGGKGKSVSGAADDSKVHYVDYKLKRTL